VQEFGRKWARNDYPLLALWEMGVRLAKIPDVDVLEDEPRRRLRLMHRFGQRHVVTVLGAPRDALLDRVDAQCGVAAFEVNMTLDGFERGRDALRAARERSAAMVYLAKILTDAEAHFDGKTFSHFVKSGFTVDEAERHGDLVAEAIARGEIDGVTVRVEIDESLADAAPRLRALRERTGAALLVSIKLAGASLAVARDDDRQTAALAAQAMVLSRCGDGICYVFDTFMDVDRGYFPRHAFIDRRFNPRPAAGVFAMLASRFAGDAAFELVACERHGIEFSTPQGRWRLLCAAPGDAGDALRDLAPATPVIDLHAGEETTAGAVCRGAPAGLQTLLVPLEDVPCP